MAKIKLDVDVLQVESFDTAPAVAARGTVHGQQLVGNPTWGCETYRPEACTDGTYPAGSCLLQCYVAEEEGPEIIG